MLIFYPLIIILGIVTSYTDIKFKKIRNNHLIYVSISGLLIYLYLILNNIMLLNSDFLLNIIIGLCLGFLLFFTETWGAGDAKLFAVYCLLMPAKKYSEILPFFSVVIFINIFLISTLAILVLSLGKIIKNRNFSFKKIPITNFLSKLSYSFMLIFSVGWIISPLTSQLSQYITTFLYILLLYFSYLFVFGLMYKLKNKYFIIIILGAGLISRFIYQRYDFNLPQLLVYLKSTFLFSIIFYSLNFIFSLNKDETKTENLIPFAPLMFLGAMAANTSLMYWVMSILNSLGK